VARYCHENLTGYKRPKYIEFRDELPKTNVGKILRRELRNPLEAAQPPSLAAEGGHRQRGGAALARRSLASGRAHGSVFHSI
jgi:hypothetical protein